MANGTKEKILAAALEMFSQNGYAGTNIRELSASLGLVKSGVYKHYASKEAIWSALLDQMTAYYTNRFGSSDRLPPVPDSAEELTLLTMHMVNITVHDEKIVMIRKVLTLEQYRDARARELATKHFLTGLTERFTHVFAGMMDKGLIHRDDPAMLAFAYTAPISALIRLCDREPEKRGCDPEDRSVQQALYRGMRGEAAGTVSDVKKFQMDTTDISAAGIIESKASANRIDPSFLQREDFQQKQSRKKTVYRVI